MGHGSGVKFTVRRLWPLKPTDKILFLFLFIEAQARNFIIQGSS